MTVWHCILSDADHVHISAIKHLWASAFLASLSGMSSGIALAGTIQVIWSVLTEDTTSSPCQGGRVSSQPVLPQPVHFLAQLYPLSTLTMTVLLPGIGVVYHWFKLGCNLADLSWIPQLWEHTLRFTLVLDMSKSFAFSNSKGRQMPPLNETLHVSAYYVCMHACLWKVLTPTR